MPRYYRRRYTRVVRPKKKWATNMREISLSFPTEQSPTADFGLYTTLCVNSSETTTQSVVSPTPTIVKTGNYKVQCDLILSNSAASMTDASVFILYVPEGITLGSTVREVYAALTGLVLRHPEWVLAWRQLGADWIASNSSVQRVTFSSRLKRNLNSGDRVIFALVGKNQTGGAVSSCRLSGFAQFWTCAN